MERKKEATRILLEEGLKELMKRNSFEKITVKMITDEAGVLRPTFYNYFQDKYELLEGIFCEDIEKQMRELGMDEDTIQRLHTYDWQQFKAERNFYEWQSFTDEDVEEIPETAARELKNIDDLLNSIENQKVLKS